MWAIKKLIYWMNNGIRKTFQSRDSVWVTGSGQRRIQHNCLIPGSWFWRAVPRKYRCWRHVWCNICDKNVSNSDRYSKNEFYVKMWPRPTDQRIAILNWHSILRDVTCSDIRIIRYSPDGATRPQTSQLGYSRRAETDCRRRNIKQRTQATPFTRSSTYARCTHVSWAERMATRRCRNASKHRTRTHGNRST